MHVLVLFGTRPEAIKMAPLVLALRQRNEVRTTVCVTAQHREMLDQVLELFGIVPDFDLDIMKPGQDLFDVTSKVLFGLRDVLRITRPDLVLVHGDTTTCMAGALAAFYERIPVGHVEAGLRTHDIASPFPEEANRQIVSRLASLHFAPTPSNALCLAAEGIDEKTICITGNTVIDSLFLVCEKLDTRADFRARAAAEIRSAGLLPPLSDLGRFILVTGHRRENFGEGFQNVCMAIRTLSRRYPDSHFVYPVHLNPNVQQPVHELLRDADNIHLIRPVGYTAFIHMMNACHIVLTDSGGIQEEAPSLGKPTVVMRKTTERQEAVEAGTVLLVGTDTRRIVEAIESLLLDADRYEDMAARSNPYGNGTASARIIDRLLSFHR